MSGVGPRALEAVAERGDGGPVCRPLLASAVKRGSVELAEKPLHGLQQAADGRLALPPSVEKARTAVREFNAFLAQLGR